MVELINYAVPGRMTALDGISPAALQPVATTPVEICFPVHHLVIQPTDEIAKAHPVERMAENQTRPAAALLARLLTLDPAPVTIAREPAKRIVGTCRHFAVLACALLRYRGIPSRVRCGFATYFQPGQRRGSLDH